jgi:hypothetical protein
VYRCEMCATKVEDVRRLVGTERAMVRWLCGVTLTDSKSSQELLDRLDVEDVVDASYISLLCFTSVAIYLCYLHMSVILQMKSQSGNDAFKHRKYSRLISHKYLL